jgi:acyl-coenzyme A synthetase/AMP-(fatty) acid ligase
MNYELTDPLKSPKEIIKRVIESDDSQLLVPPQYSKNEVEIRKLYSKDKSIGLFSSGTTATPKCIWNTFQNLMENGRRAR